MSFVRNLLKYNKKDFSNKELKLLKISFQWFSKILSSDDDKLGLIKIIELPENISRNDFYEKGIKALEEKNLAKENSLYLSSYLYYEKYFKSEISYLDYFCDFLSYFVKNSNILESPIFYDKNFNETFHIL
ncbi:MAG: hypothetical protein BAJALOKI2v1_420029 [Promethearchaeota archaeon]|nr:MAG: hypothetical protein BAJALOKI2v1_420029 [Candidatus Lokiarchaeota archaeon]